MKPLGGVFGGDVVSYSRIYKSSLKSKKNKNHGTKFKNG